MTLEILQFASRIAFRGVLRRGASRVIHRGRSCCIASLGGAPRRSYLSDPWIFSMGGLEGTPRGVVCSPNFRMLPSSPASLSPFASVALLHESPIHPGSAAPLSTPFPRGGWPLAGVALLHQLPKAPRCAASLRVPPRLEGIPRTNSHPPLEGIPRGSSPPTFE